MSFRRYFQLKFNPVGVKLIAKEIQNAEVEERFCEAVREATMKRIVVSAFNCAGAELSLFLEPLKGSEAEAVVLEPYHEQGDYDVVLIIATPDKLMEVARAYRQIFGDSVVARLSGTRAVCGEATADVIKTGEPNVSFLCDGARFLGGYGNDEVVMGFPAQTFREFERAITAGRLKSLCDCLTDDLPEHVKKAFMAMGFDKATDHFLGYVNGSIVNVYVFKGEVSNRIAIFASVKFRNEDEAEKAVNTLSDDEVIVYRRGNWVELSKILTLDEDIGRAVRRDGFERWFTAEVEQLAAKTKELRKIKQQ